MKRPLLVAALCLHLAAVSASLPGLAQDSTSRAVPIQPNAAQANLATVRQYYAAMIAGVSPNIAGLTLMMTLMPKGGDLHHHYSGSLYAETFLDWVKEKGFCVWKQDNPQRQGAFKFTIESKPQELTEDVKPNCLKVEDILLSSNNAFYHELLSTWSDKDFYNHSHQQPPPDQQFFDTFFYIGPISGAYPDKGLQLLKARAIAENVQYIETMLNRPPATRNDALAGPINALTSVSANADVQAAIAPFYDYLAADPDTRQAIDRFQAGVETATNGIDDKDFRMRFQTYVTRNDPPATVFSGLYSSFAAANAGGKVVGVNIVGPENLPVSMRDYSLHMRMFAFLKQKFPGVRLSLHAGELTLGMVPPEGLRHHIREAVEIAGAMRIGHGVDIAYEQDSTGLLRLMREKKVAVEINLTSNEFILGVKGEAHPILLYRHAGVPFVISTDDSGVSRNNLSAEYVLYAARYRPNYDALKETVSNSIRLSFLTDAEKTSELAKLAQRFATFEAKMAEMARGLPVAKGP
jgi:adenosine deaminase